MLHRRFALTAFVTLLTAGIVGCGGATETTADEATDADPVVVADGAATETSADDAASSDAPSNDAASSDAPSNDAASSDAPSSDASTADTQVGGDPDTGGVDARPDAVVDANDPITPGPRLKVMTFNIRVGTANDGPNEWSLRKGLVYDVLRDQDADLVGLQEDLRFQLNAIADAVPRYKRIGVGAKNGTDEGEHCAILYKYETLALRDSGTFWLSNTPGVPGSITWGNDGNPRIVTWGRFAVRATGYEFFLYNTHFDHQSQNSREKSALAVMARLDRRELPFLLMGDLNVQEDNVVTRFFKGNANIDGQSNPVPLFDTFRVVHPNETHARTAHGFGGATLGDKIDYIYMATKNVLGANIVHYNVDGRYPSDHYPVTATVKLPGAP